MSKTLKHLEINYRGFKSNDLCDSFYIWLKNKLKNSKTNSVP